MLATRAVTIGAPPLAVWPWLVQMGSGRGGAYTHDWVENLLGMRMHSANEVLPQFQGLAVGDVLRIPNGPSMRVAVLDRERVLTVGRRRRRRERNDALDGRAGREDRRRYGCRPRDLHRATREKGSQMPEFMDVHTGMVGITPEQLAEAHQADVDIQGDEGVVFKQAWADPQSGRVFCLAEGPSADAVRRIHERAGHPADEIYEITVTV